MKSPLRLFFVLSLGLNSWLFAEVNETRSQVQARSPQQLEQILGPIALYPDALLGIILPASTFPSDIVLASRYLNSGGDPAQIEQQPWDDSVQSLARYPDVVKWMDENLAWTAQLGEVFLAQPEEVMATVQRLRAKAQSAGTLVSTPQQQVVVSNQVIEIVPAQPDVIYVPYYDPAIVYVRPSPFYHDPFFTFSVGFSTGAWLAYEPDWRRGHVIVIDRPYRSPQWNRPGFPGRPVYGPRPPSQPWRPSPGFMRPTRPLSNHAPGIVPPRPYQPRVDQNWNRPYPPHTLQPGSVSPPPRNPGVNRPPSNNIGNPNGNRPSRPDRNPNDARPRPSSPPPGNNNGASSPPPRPRPENNARPAPSQAQQQPRQNPPQNQNRPSPQQGRPAPAPRPAPEKAQGTDNNAR